MNYKKTIFIAGGILLGLLILYVSVTYVAKQKLETAIGNLPEHIQVKYDAAHVNLLKGNVALKNPLVDILAKATGKKKMQISLTKVALNGFSYWDYFVNDTISIESINVEKPNLLYYQDKASNSGNKGSDSSANKNKAFKINRLSINNATVQMKSRETDSVVLETDGLKLNLGKIVSKKKGAASKLPFSFEDMLFLTKNLKYKMNDFENLTISDVEITRDSSKIYGIGLKTKYGQRELSKIIETERDHFNIQITSMEINNQDVELQNKSNFVFRAGNVMLNKPNAIIYRDKLVADDNTKKPMYSEMLRNLGFDLGINRVEIKDATIIYKEKVKPDNPAGKIEFENLNAKITNLGNVYDKSDRLEIAVNADFMETAPVNVNWSFKVSDTTDSFVFKADLGKLHADQLNQFTKPNVRVKLEGELLQTYFTIGGNANSSQIELKTDYEYLDVIMLKEDGNEKKGLVSGIVNLFVSKNSNDKKGNFRYGYAKEVKRDKTKSIFNFVWLNIRDGLKDAVTGAGKKKK